MNTILQEHQLQSPELRLKLWQEVLRFSGINLSKRRMPASAEKDVRDSMVNCQKCARSMECMKVVRTAAKQGNVPDSCPNELIIRRLRLVC